MELKNKKIIYYILIISILLFFFFFINIFSSGWFKHPDEHGSYFAIDNLLKKGSIGLEDSLRNFIPDGYYKVGNLFSSPKPALEFYLLSIFFILSPKLFFFVVPLLSFLCLILLFISIRQNYKLNNNLSFFFVFLFGSSFLFFYWANFPYFNLIASIFFILGLSIFLSYQEASKFITPILFSFAILLRYEFLLIFIIISLLIFILEKNRRKNILFIFILVGLMISPLLLFNEINYGNPLNTPYFTNDGHISNSLGGNFLEKIMERFFKGDLNPDFNRIVNNFNDWFFNLYPWLIIFMLLSLFYSWRNVKIEILQILLIIPAIYWAYNVLRGYHWGENANFMGAVYVRYLSFTIISSFIFILPYFKNFIKENKRIIYFLIFFIIIQSVLLCFNSPPDDLPANLEKNYFYKNINSKLIEENSSIVLTSFYGKYLTKEEVINLRAPTFYQGDNYIEDLLESKESLIIKYDNIIIFKDTKREDLEGLYKFLDKINYSIFREEEFLYKDLNLKWIIFKNSKDLNFSQ